MFQHKHSLLPTTLDGYCVSYLKGDALNLIFGTIVDHFVKHMSQYSTMLEGYYKKAVKWVQSLRCLSLIKKLKTALTHDHLIKFCFKIVARRVNRNTIARSQAIIFLLFLTRGRLSTTRIRLKAYFIHVLKENKSILGLGTTQQTRLIIFGTFCIVIFCCKIINNSRRKHKKIISVKGIVYVIQICLYLHEL